MNGLAVIAVALLCACAPEAGPAANDVNLTATATPEQPAESREPRPLGPAAPGRPGGLPDDRAPLAEAAIDPKSPQGAAQVIQRYFALVEEGRSEDAAALWSTGAELIDTGRYGELHATIGAPGRPEGAAGSTYVEIPVQLYGRRKTGEPFNALGTMTLRRVNDVPGATAEQLGWRIFRSDFRDVAK